MLRGRFWLQSQDFGASVGAIGMVFRDLSVPTGPGVPGWGGGDQGPGTKTRDIGTREKAIQVFVTVTGLGIGPETGPIANPTSAP